MTSPSTARPRALSDPQAASDYISELLESLSRIADGARLTQTGAILEMAAMLAQLEAQSASLRLQDGPAPAGAAGSGHKART